MKEISNVKGWKNLSSFNYSPSFDIRMEILENKYHTVTISIYDKDTAYKEVGELLHIYSNYILLRTGYPIREKNFAIIFLILEMTNDQLGALTGKLGQIKSVKVKSISLNL